MKLPMFGRTKARGHAEKFLERRPETNICWWCGAEATTAEHKFKQTDIRRVKGDDKFFYHYSDGDGRLGRVNGVNSQRVKFRKNLCGPCNNSRSQPFDYAYTTFSTHMNDHMATIYDLHSLDMASIFPGQDAQTEALNLARYFMKYLGCRIDDSGFQVPAEIRKFCDDGTFMPHVEIVFYRDRALNLYNEAYRAIGTPNFPLYHSGVQAALSEEDGMMPFAMYGESIIGNIGVMYGWNARLAGVSRPFYVNTTAHLHERSDLPLDDHYKSWPDHLKAFRKFV